MGNSVACSTKRKDPKRHDKQDDFPNKSEQQPQSLQIPINKSQQNINDSKIQTDATFSCLHHKGEPFRAICTTIKCLHTSRILCSECLIDHTCPNKLRLLEFVNRLRSKLSKEALDVFMEIFDDNNSVKLETEKVIHQIVDQIKTKIHEVQEKSISQIVIHFHQSQSELKTRTLNEKIVKELELILNGNKINYSNFIGNTPQVSNETIELAILFIQRQDLVEILCSQLEKTKASIAAFANDFQQKFQALLAKFINCLKFLFELLISPMEFIHEDELPHKGAKKTQKQQNQQQSQYLHPKNATKDKQKGKDDKSDKTDAKSRSQIQQETEKGSKKVEALPLLLKCQTHQNEILAICTSENCSHKNRKMCADCLIENSACQNRMRLIEFNSRVNRVINKEVIEELIIPWEEGTVSIGLRKLLTEGLDIVQKQADELISQELKQMYVKYHLIQNAIPSDLNIDLTKQFFMEFTKMVQEGQIYSGNKSIELAVQFINNQTLIDQFLGAIVKTEQLIPQEAEKLQNKIISLTQLFLEDFNHLVEIFKQQTDNIIIQKSFSSIIEEPFLIEESIYKLKSIALYTNILLEDGKFISEWTLSYQFNPQKNASIIDICMINEQVVALGCSEGSIIIWNIYKQKHLTTLKHGGFVSSLVSLKYNGQSVIISSGFSMDSGCSLSTWDLTSKKPNFQFKNAHNDSIRRVKYLYVNPSLSQSFQKGSDTTNQSSTLNQSGVSSQAVGSQPIGSQSDISVDEQKTLEQIISCSDDGTIKLWKLTKDLKLEEDCLLRKKGPCVLDFTILNGCILVAAIIDKTIQISLPFHNTQPFQQIYEDSPVYAISPLEQINQKLLIRKKQITPTSQQRFMTGNERGFATIYTWQNGRAVVFRVLQLHNDKINRINILQPSFIATISNDQTVALSLISQTKVLALMVKMILAKLKGHQNSVTSLVFLKEQGSIVTTDQNGEVIVWK